MTALDAEVEHRLRLIRDDVWEDDLAVALGLLAAGFSARPASAGAELDRGSVDEVLTGGGRWRPVMYDLWYRMKIPFGTAPLDSWYLLALSFGRTSGDVAAAVDLHGDLVQRLAAEEKPAALLAEEFGLDGPLRDGTVREFTEAVLTRAPFWSGGPGPWAADLRQRMLDGWAALREEERPVLLLELRQRIEGLEQVRFFVRGELLENKQVAAELFACAGSEPATWDDSRLAVATLAWMWRESGFCLQELNQSIISIPLVLDFVVRRVRFYEQVLGADPAPLPASVLDLARLLGRLRVAIERDHHRCLQFDGGNWERREFLVPRSECVARRPLPDDLRARLGQEFGTTLTDEGPEVWAAALDAAVAAGRTATDVVKALAHWAVEDTALPVDYAIFTVPMGVKLGTPWELEYEDVFCYTAFNQAFDREVEEVPFDHVGIANAIGQRLRYNVVKKAQNYTLLRRMKAQSFNLPDIAVAEDANHGGHRAAGIRLSCRMPTYVHHDGIAWKGLADVRLNRTFYREHHEFRPSDIPLASRLAEWLGWIADAAYARGLLFDPVYGKKLVRTETET